MWTGYWGVWSQLTISNSLRQAPVWCAHQLECNHEFCFGWSSTVPKITGYPVSIAWNNFVNYNLNWSGGSASLRWRIVYTTRRAFRPGLSSICAEYITLHVKQSRHYKKTEKYENEVDYRWMNTPFNFAKIWARGMEMYCSFTGALMMCVVFFELFP